MKNKTNQKTIPSRAITVTKIPAKEKPHQKTKVAAYARVSAGNDLTARSFNNQKEYYMEYIATHPECELVGIYADYGISGTKENRPEFNRLMDDCRAGKVDMIITKSVTRFSRNLVLLLKSVRELTILGIDVYFEKENFHTMSASGEFILTAMGFYAEAEAESCSENIKLSRRRRYKEGKLWNLHIYGYKQVGDHLEIVPEEAEIVKLIYDLFLDGYGTYQISKILNSEGVKPRYSEQWYDCTIHRILTNETYVGDLILQQGYYDKNHRYHINNGELPKYYITDAHEAIIDRATQEKVKAVFAKRKQEQEAGKQLDSIWQERTKDLPDHDPAKHPNAFHGLIICGHCNKRFVRLRHYYSYKQYKTHRNAKRLDHEIVTYHVCGKRNSTGGRECKNTIIPEPILASITREILGLSETIILTRELLAELLDKIVINDFELSFYLKNGEIKTATWQPETKRGRTPRKASNKPKPRRKPIEERRHYG